MFYLYLFLVCMCIFFGIFGIMLLVVSSLRGGEFGLGLLFCLLFCFNSFLYLVGGGKVGGLGVVVEFGILFSIGCFVMFIL